MIRRFAHGLVVMIALLLMQGAARSFPLESGDTAAEPTSFSELLTLADLDFDHAVTGSDFLPFRKCYLEGGPECETADFDHDRDVDRVDFDFFVAAILGDASRMPTLVISPEPGTLLLIAGGCTVLAIRRRRVSARS